MIDVRPAEDRGHADHGWLDTRHTFSFADYHDPDHMGFRLLRVLNEDRVRPGQGFGSHPHQDMEILTWVLDGALEHMDSLGNTSVIRPGELQRMSAGTGVTHSEWNHSEDDPVHFLQMWVLPHTRGLAPGYEQRAFPASERYGRLRPIASPDGADGSVRVHADVRLLVALLDDGQRVTHEPAAGRHAWVHVARGEIELNGALLGAGDGAGVHDEERLVLEALESTEVLVYDLP